MKQNTYQISELLKNQMQLSRKLLDEKAVNILLNQESTTK